MACAELREDAIETSRPLTYHRRMTRLAELSDTDLAMAAMWLLALIAAVVVLVRILAFLAHEFRADLREYREDAQRRRTAAPAEGV